MTPILSATNVVQQQNLPFSLRKSDQAVTTKDSRIEAEGTAAQVTLQKLFQRLIAGWKWVERKRTQQLASRRLHLAETITLGEKRSISIVQVDGSQYLIGCSAGSVQLLAILSGQEVGITPSEKEATS